MARRMCEVRPWGGSACAAEDDAGVCAEKGRGVMAEVAMGVGTWPPLRCMGVVPMPAAARLTESEGFMASIDVVRASKEVPVGRAGAAAFPTDGGCPSAECDEAVVAEVAGALGLVAVAAAAFFFDVFEGVFWFALPDTFRFFVAVALVVAVVAVVPVADVGGDMALDRQMYICVSNVV